MRLLLPVLLLMPLGMGTAHAMERGYPLVASHRVQTTLIDLTGVCVSPGSVAPRFRNFELLQIPAATATTCKGKTVDQCEPLDASSREALRVQTRGPTRQWNFGTEFDPVLAVFNQELRADYKERLDAWLAETLPSDALESYPRRHSLQCYGDFVPVGLPLRTVKPIEAVILEVQYEARNGRSTGEIERFVLDLKLVSTGTPDARP